MANLAELCASLPKEFEEREEYRAHVERVALQRKWVWHAEKRKEHQKLLAYRDRERCRAMRPGVQRGVSLESSRANVRRETMPPTLRPETTADIFYAGKGVRQPKKVKNKASSEEMGTIRPHIMIKRFAGSHLTCVCKSKRINIYK